MEILSDSISTGVPESYFFYQIETDSVIWKRESHLKEGWDIGEVNCTVRLIIGPWEDWDVLVISSEGLCWLEDRL